MTVAMCEWSCGVVLGGTSVLHEDTESIYRRRCRRVQRCDLLCGGRFRYFCSQWYHSILGEMNVRFDRGGGCVIVWCVSDNGTDICSEQDDDSAISFRHARHQAAMSIIETRIIEVYQSVIHVVLLEL